jgi:hypothetical protein
VLNRWEKSNPRDDDRERVARARQTAEALFTPKPQVAEPTVVGSLPPADPPARKPRVLGISSPAAARSEAVEPPVSAELRVAPQVPASQFPRIRSWVKYGMTPAQVAKIYGVSTADIERILRDA